jgi:exonuclease VII small subunit
LQLIVHTATALEEAEAKIKEIEENSAKSSADAEAKTKELMASNEELQKKITDLEEAASKHEDALKAAEEKGA